MTPLFTKLNLGTAQVIHVLHAPASFETELDALQGIDVRREVVGTIVFALAFVKTLADVQRATHQLDAHAEGDVTVWMAYPKGSSKKLQCEFNRDSGWARLGEAGYEPVRQVSIDEDWSALRFRKVTYIKKMTRAPARTISEAGRKQTGSASRPGKA